MSISLNYLSSLYGGSSASSGSGDLLAMLYGYAGQSASGSGQNPVTALTSAEQKQPQLIKATAAQPEVSRAVQAFTAGVAAAKTVPQLLANPAVMKVLLTANGLGDQASFTALAQKALQSDTNDPNSLANKLTDTRWKSVAQTYDFANKGLSVIQNPSVISTIANGYAEVTWRHSLDAATPGLSDALTFRQQAASISSVDQILGDPLLRRVVTTTLNLPLQIALQPLQTQEKAVSSRLDIGKFKDPKYVESFVQRYLLAAQSNAAASTTPDMYSLAVKAQGLIV